MHRLTCGVLGAVATLLTSMAVIPSATAAPAPTDAPTAHRSDNHPGPLTARQDARRKAAQKLILSGKA